MRHRPWRVAVTAVLIAGMILGTWRPAVAHNAAVHRGMTEIAFLIMAGSRIKSRVPQQPLRPPPPRGVSAADWTRFLDDLQVASTKLAWMSSPCDKGAPVGSVFPTPEGNLGNCAAAIDKNVDDTHVGVNPSNVGGIGFATSILDQAERAGLKLLLVPVVCAVSCIADFLGLGGGDDCDKCVDTAKRLAADAPAPGDLNGMVPLVGDFNWETFTGTWHFVNVRNGPSNTYDDHQGLLYEEAGPDGVPGAADVAVMAATDLAGLTINYDRSEGVHKYQVPRPGDTFPDGDRYEGTNERGQIRWQAHPLGHTPFEPVDNLAYYGWNRFRSATSRETGWNFENLGYPLHALGDATVPMHVVGSSAHGHRPFEDAQEALWPDIVDRLAGPQVRAQILARAFEYRQEIESWRAAGHSGDVAIRHLVRSVARRTLALSGSSGSSDWPFNDPASTLYLALPQQATDIYRGNSNAVGLVEPYLVEGIAAKIAFLMSAVDRVPVPPPVDNGPHIAALTNPARPAEAPPAAAMARHDQAARDMRAAYPAVPRVPAKLPPIPSKLPPPVGGGPELAFFQAVNRDYSRLARLLIAEKITPAVYLQMVRDRTRKSERARKDPSWAASWICGDYDGDLVPNDRDGGPNTPDLRPTDDRGRATNEPPPKAPSAVDVREALSRLKFRFAPKCQNAPAPLGVEVGDLRFVGPQKGVFSVTVSREKNQSPGCEVFYQVSVRVVRTVNLVIPPTSYADFVFRDSDDQQAGPGNLNSRVFQISKADPKLSESMRRALFELTFGLKPQETIEFTTFDVRVRTIAPNGLASEWSGKSLEVRP